MAGLQHISLALAALVIAGCARDVVIEPPQRSVVRVRNFSDATAVRALAVAPPYLFVATETGLDRWDLSTGGNLRLNAEHGLAGDRVFALDYDASRKWLWIATDGGLQRYDVGASTFTALPAPAEVLGVGPLEGAVLEAAGDGGVWLGLPTGLFYASDAGGWTNTGVAEAVRAVFRDRDGTLWIGTERGLLVTGADRVARRLGDEDGCEISRIDHIIAAPDDGGAGRVLVVGTGDEQVRAALVGADGCSTYRAAPDEPWDAVVSSGDGVIVLAGRALYRLDGARRQGPRRLERDGLRLVPLPGSSLAAARALDLSRLDVVLPSGTEVVAAASGELFLGTRSLGTARVAVTGRGQERWLRRGELAAGAVHLTVACASEDDCLIATGTRRLWHFDGAGFRDVADGDGPVLAALRGPQGGLQIVRGTPGEPRLRLAARRDGGFVDDDSVVVETPGVEASISFARYAPGGVLWLGLRYREEGGALRPHGVALVDAASGEVVYHHAGGTEGVWPVPINVVDATFIGDEAWLATMQGAARVKGGEVELFSEARGLRSEILRGIACSAGGVVYVASSAGVGENDGESWGHVRALGHPVDDLAIGADGQLWMATERGLGAYDGDRVRRLDARRGLLEDHIREIEVDGYGRIWLLGDEGISLVVP